MNKIAIFANLLSVTFWVLLLMIALNSIHKVCRKMPLKGSLLILTSSLVAAVLLYFFIKFGIWQTTSVSVLISSMSFYLYTAYNKNKKLSQENQDQEKGD